MKAPGNWKQSKPSQLINLPSTQFGKFSIKLAEVGVFTDSQENGEMHIY